MAHIAYDNVALTALSTTDQFTAEMGIVFLFEELNLGNPERNRLWKDGIQAIGDMVDQYGYDIKSFKAYLQNLNKTFALATNPGDKVYFLLQSSCNYVEHCSILITV